MTNESNRQKFSPEVRERAVRMVAEHRGEHSSQWAAIVSISAKIGCTAQTLSTWMKQSERDQGHRPGLTTDERDRLRQLERENRELRQANEILRKASAYFARGESSTANQGHDEVHRRAPVSVRGHVEDVLAHDGRSAMFCRLPRRPTTSTPAAGLIRRRRHRASSAMKC